jgi:hypothetical protein
MMYRAAAQTLLLSGYKLRSASKRSRRRAYAFTSCRDDHIAIRVGGRYDRLEFMEESELRLPNAAPRGALREYAWFAIFLLGLAALMAFKSHS